MSVSLFLAVTFATPVLALGAVPPPPLAQQVEGLIAKQEKAMLDFQKRYLAAEDAAQEALLMPFFPDPRPVAEKLFRLAEKHPKDPAAVTALLWVVRNGRGGPKSRSAQAQRILVRDHLRHPKIGALCQELKYDQFDAEAEKFIRRVLKESPHKEAQANAALALAYRLQQSVTLVRRWKKASEKELPNIEKIFGKEAVAALRRQDPDEIEKEAGRLYELIIRTKEYAAPKIRYGSDDVALGELAKRFLFRMRHLQPGKPAPEIVGEDIDGKPMKLSDFRGKVVLLDFWGHW
jgi:hypothetical protein